MRSTSKNRRVLVDFCIINYFFAKPAMDDSFFTMISTMPDSW